MRPLGVGPDPRVDTFDFQHKAATLGSPVKVFVRDPLGPADAADFPEAYIVEGIDLHVMCCHPPAF